MSKGEKKDEKEIKKYDLSDKVIRESVFGDSIHAKLLTNEKGTYIDMRKYFRDKPTKRGLRIRLKDYKTMTDFITECIQAYQNQ